MARMTPLRRRLIDDMTVRNLSPATQQSYVYAVAKFSLWPVARSAGCGRGSRLPDPPGRPQAVVVAHQPGVVLLSAYGVWTNLSST